MSSCDSKAKSEEEIMWTNQHGTGPQTDDRVETQLILQYMCQPYPEGKMATPNVNLEFEHHTIRNGQTLNTQTFANGAHAEYQFSINRAKAADSTFTSVFRLKCPSRAMGSTVST